MHASRPSAGLIIALDFPTVEDAKVFFDDHIAPIYASLPDLPTRPALIVKVGLQLLYQPGCMEWLDTLKQQQVPLFLDVKMFDIPSTVRGGVRSLVERYRPAMITVTAVPQVVTAAREAIDCCFRAGEASTQLLGVTVLTSMGHESALYASFVEPETLVTHMAGAALDNGADGIVCAAQDISRLENSLERPDKSMVSLDDFAIVTPGIRFSGDDKDDQRRVSAPEDAIALGANFLVMGRSITRASHPAARIEEVLRLLDKA
ncbi:MAG: orotidine-5'-phosphate decarboxylase [Alphaproteobacteria bacterium]|nr:orotidine-5'-phosphate decarboxylase [Alphaproteobacteria bacterium]